MKSTQCLPNDHAVAAGRLRRTGLIRRPVDVHITRSIIDVSWVSLILPSGVPEFMSGIHCEHCTAVCCRYLALPIDKPRTRRDYDDVRWYLMHEGVQVFVEEGDWYIQFQTRCKNLAANNLCMVYETRPLICRDYKPGECDYSEGSYGYDHMFTHPRHIEDFYFKRTGKHLGVLKPHPKGRAGKQTRARAACSSST